MRQTTEPIHATREGERERERLGSSFFALSRREHKAESERDGGVDRLRPLQRTREGGGVEDLEGGGREGGREGERRLWATIFSTSFQQSPSQTLSLSLSPSSLLAVAMRCRRPSVRD